MKKSPVSLTVDKIVEIWKLHMLGAKMDEIAQKTGFTNSQNDKNKIYIAKYNLESMIAGEHKPKRKTYIKAVKIIKSEMGKEAVDQFTKSYFESRQLGRHPKIEVADRIIPTPAYSNERTAFSSEEIKEKIEVTPVETTVSSVFTENRYERLERAFNAFTTEMSVFMQEEVKAQVDKHKSKLESEYQVIVEEAKNKNWINNLHKKFNE